MAKCLFCKFDNCYAEFERHRSHTTLSAVDLVFGQINKVLAAINNKTEVPQTNVCEKHTQEGEIGRFLNRFWTAFDQLKKGVALPAIRVR